MKYQIKKISALQTSKVTAIIYAPFGFIYTLIGLAILLDGKPEGDWVGILLLLGPVLIAVLTFVMTLFICWFYNWVASLVGGIEIELVEKPAITIKQMRKDLAAATRPRTDCPEDEWE